VEGGAPERANNRPPRNNESRGERSDRKEQQPKAFNLSDMTAAFPSLGK